MSKKPPKGSVANLKQKQLTKRARPITSILAPTSSMPNIADMNDGPMTMWSSYKTKNLSAARRLGSTPKELFRTYNSSSISILTHDRNNHDNERMEQMRIKQSQANRKFNIHGDTKALLAKTELQLRSMKYKLTTLVSNGEGHINLPLSFESQIEVFPSTLVYARVVCKGKEAPLKVFLKYNTKGDIKIFCSLKEIPFFLL